MKARQRRIIGWGVATATAIVLAVVALNPWVITEAYYYARRLMHRFSQPRVEATKAELDGIDVSHFQGDINWPMVAQNPKVRFAYIKATEGYGYTDSHFKRNYRGACSSGIEVGVYHVFTMKNSGLRQYQYFKRAVGKRMGSLVPMVDLEYDKIGSAHPDSLRAHLMDFCQQLEKDFGCRPLIYSTRRVYDDMLHPAFSEYPLWIARYGSPPVLHSRRKYSLWQFTERGHINGIDEDVDFNRFANGADLQFIQK